MQISPEGKLGLLVALTGMVGGAIGLSGAGLMQVAPTYVWVGWTLIVTGVLSFTAAIVGGLALAAHHFGITRLFVVALLRRFKSLYFGILGVVVGVVLTIAASHVIPSMRTKAHPPIVGPPQRSPLIPSPTPGSITPPVKSLSNADKEALKAIYINMLGILQQGEDISKGIDLSRSLGDPASIKYVISRVDKNITDLEKVEKEIESLEGNSIYQYYYDSALKSIELSDPTQIVEQPLKRLISTLGDVSHQLSELALIASTITGPWDKDQSFNRPFTYQFNDIGVALVAPIRVDNNKLQEWIEQRRSIVLRQRELLQ